MIFNMHDHAVDAVGAEGTSFTSFFPARPEHEVINDELAASVKEIAERFLPMTCVENVFLFDLDPRQFHALGPDRVALPGEFFFPGQQALTGGEPFFLRNDGWVFNYAGCHNYFS